MTLYPKSELSPDVYLPRLDLIYDKTSDEAADVVTKIGMVVVRGVIDPVAAMEVRSSLSKILALHTPLRAARHIVKHAYGNTERIPSVLQIQPFGVPINRAWILPHTLRGAVNRMQEVHQDLIGQPSSQIVYDRDDCELSVIRLNHNFKAKKFNRHADSYAQGMAVILQTSPTRWLLSSVDYSKDRFADVEPYYVDANAGDIVVLAERNETDIETSLMHECVNLTNRDRYSLGMFSIVD